MKLKSIIEILYTINEEYCIWKLKHIRLNKTVDDSLSAQRRKFFLLYTNKDVNTKECK